MATLVFTRNLLSRHDLEYFQVPDGSRPIEWLLEHYPHGAGGPVLHYHNGERLLAGDDEYLDRPLMAGDVALLAVPPAGIEIGVIVITAIVTAVVSAAVSIGLSLLFPDPQAPAAATPGGLGNPSPVYNVRSRQNLARLGEPVPVVYGRVLMTPDLCAQPYHMFDGVRGMWVDLLMCLGQGEFDVHEVLIGETEMLSIEGGAAQYIVVPPAAHGGIFGNLAAVSLANGWSPIFFENMWVSLEVAEQRFTNIDDESGFYRVGRVGQAHGRYIYYSVEFPRGFYQMTEWGDVTSTGVEWQVIVRQADINGDPIPGTEQVHSQTWFGGNRDPLRLTLAIDCGYTGAWLVKMRRLTTQYPNGEEMNEWYWRSLMLEIYETPTAAAYGNTTLLMVRLKAEEVSAGVERLVRVRCTRKLPTAGSGPLAATTSPDDAFIDIYCNQVYGARRPLSEVDTGNLGALRAYWAGQYSFNGVYTQKSSVWEALSQSVQGVAAAPMPVGGLMSIVQDGTRPVRSMMFSEQNIVKSTFRLDYHFEQTGAPDGIEIAFVDPDTWSPAYVRWPVGSQNPESLHLFGCSDYVQASQFARLQWQRRQRLRRLVNFDTEMEGLIPYPGERIAVAHTLPRWGVSGQVASVHNDGITVQLDRGLPWDEVPGPHYMMFRDEFGGASDLVQVTQGSTADWVILSANPWAFGQDWRTLGTQERTHFTWGDGERVVKDFTLTVLAHKGGAIVSVSGVIYDPAVYDSTLAFLVNPVPI